MLQKKNKEAYILKDFARKLNYLKDDYICVNFPCSEKCPLDSLKYKNEPICEVIRDIIGMTDNRAFELKSET